MCCFPSTLQELPLDKIGKFCIVIQAKRWHPERQVTVCHNGYEIVTRFTQKGDIPRSSVYLNFGEWAFLKALCENDVHIT